MEKHRRNTGNDILGDIRWGTHCCLFYSNTQDLLDILIPYFKAGLKNNEFCMWVTSGHPDKDTVKKSMIKAVPGFREYLERGQMEIIPYDEWYLIGGIFNIKKVVNAWIEKVNKVNGNGYNGIRVSGDTSWMQEKDWKSFTDYEARINTVIDRNKMLVICTYSLDKYRPSEVIDVVKNHHYALVKKENKWELVESSELKRKKEILSVTNSQLQILQQVMTALHGTLDLQEVFDKISDGAVQSMDYTTAFILTLDNEQDNYIIRSLSAKKGILTRIDKVFGFPLKNLKIPANQGINRIVEQVEAGKLVVTETLEEVLSPVIKKTACRIVQKFTGTKNYILVPFLVEDELVGAMFVSSSREVVTDEEFNMISNLAIAAAQAIKNAELYTQSIQADEALKQSELKFKNLFEYAKDAVIIADVKTGLIIDVNSAACKMIGRPKEKIIGMHQTEIYPPELAEYYAQNFREHVEKGIMASEEMIIQRPDGSRVLVDISANVIELDGKRVMQGVFRDITERKQAEETIKIERQNFRNSVDNSPLGILIVDIDRNILYSNQAILDMLGYDSIGDFKSIPLDKRFPAESLFILNEKTEDWRAGKPGQYALEMDIIRKDGQIRNMAVYHREVIWDGKEQHQTIWQDITEYKQTERSLRESKEFNSSLLENAPNAVIVFNPDTSVRYVNPAWVEINGWTAEEVIGIKVPYPWWSGEQKELLSNKFSLALQQDKGQSELIAKKKDGEYYWISINWAAVKRDGKIVYTLVNSIDITERKKREQLQRDENYVLTLMNQGAELKELLDAIVTLRESYNPDIRSSVMLFDSSHENLVLASGPNLPEEYIEILKRGIPLSPTVDFTGVAPYLMDCLVITDIENSPVFGPFKEVVDCLSRNNISSCWTQPIISPGGILLGTIVSYGNKLGEPNEENRRVLEWSARIAALAIEHKRAEKALSESEERFSKTFRASANAICIISTVDNRFIEVNDSFTRFTGYTHEETIGRSLSELGLWVSEKELDDFLNTINEEGKVYNKEFHSRMKTGEVRVGLMSADVIDIGGEPCRIVVITDISKHKKMEQALEVERQNFRNSIDNSPLGILIMDKDSRSLYSNKAFLSMLGYDNADDFTSIPRTNRLTQESLEQFAERRKLRKEGKTLPFSYEADIVRIDGKIRNMVVYHREVNWDGEKQYQTIWQDVTERKKAIEALEAERENFQNSIDSSPLGIIILNAERDVVYANRATLDMFGYESLDEFYSVPIEKRYTPESLMTIKERREIRKAGNPIPEKYEVDIIRKDGQIRNMIVFHREVIWNGEKQSQTLWQDDTERKKAQEQLILSDRLASVGELAAGIAHELNNPLTSVIGFSQLLLGKDLPDDIKEDIKIVCSEAQRTAAIVKNLLTFARKHTPVKQMININNSIEQVLQMRVYEQRVNNIHTERRFTPDLPEVMADQFQLQQVFLNIIINAEHFMIEKNQGGILTITTRKEGNIVRISFTDDGPGISKENMKHLFDPFFTTKEVGRGTGLGLSICHGIITEHDGRIYAESESGKGATFIVELPAMHNVRDGVIT